MENATNSNGNPQDSGASRANVTGHRASTSNGNKIAVYISNEYPPISRDKLWMHFGKTRNGGGDIKSLICPYKYHDKDVAVIEFERNECVQSVIKKQSKIQVRGKVSVSLAIEHFEEVVTCGSMQLNERLYKMMKSHLNSELNRIIDESDVEIEEETCCITGDWYKIWFAKKEMDRLIACNSHLLRHNAEVISEQILPQDDEFYDCREESTSDAPDTSSENDAPPAVVEKSISEAALPEKVNQLSGSSDFGDSVDEQVTIKSCDDLRVDYHFMEYIRLTNAGRLDELMREYCVQLEEKEKNGFVILKLQSSDTSGEAKNKLENMVNEIQSNSEMQRFGPVEGHDDLIKTGIEAVQKTCPKTLYVGSLYDHGQYVLFIGSSETLCINKAVSVFYAATGLDLFQFRMTDTKTKESRPEYSTELERHVFDDGKLLLLVLRGDIVHQSATAIVNAANENLHDGGGVTGAIYEAGGKEFRNRCDDAMKERNYKPLEIGEVVVTESCGRLNCKSVLHAVAPQYYQCLDEMECLNKMQCMCSEILSKANQEQYQSISIPAMGTGIYGVPIALFCKALICSIDKLCQSSHTRHLKEIRLVNYDTFQAKDIAWCISEELKDATCIGLTDVAGVF